MAWRQPAAGNIQVVDYLNGSHMKSFAYAEVENRAHLSEVSRLCYCAEHMTVISVSWDGSIDVHDESEPERGVLLRRLSGGHKSDIAAVAFSFHLSLIASGSSDHSLHVWDFEFGRFDGTCIGHVSGVLAVQFLDPFPLLLSTDNTGNVCVWGVRPSYFKGKCVYRFRNQRGAAVGGGIASINCVAIYVTAGSYLLVAGDDKGALSVWDMQPTLQLLEDEHGIRRLEKPIECVNPRRNLRVHAEGMVRKVRNGPEWEAFRNRDPTASFFFSSGMPLLPDRMPTRLHQWRAHSDIVYSIQVISEPQSLITSSFDRRVKVWSLSGECLGILMQGEMELSRRPWKFRPDYDARERRKELAVETVIEEIHRLNEDAERADSSGSSSHRARRRGLGQQSASPPPDESSVLEDANRRAVLPPLQATRHRSVVPLPSAPTGIRKTPRRAPVTSATAGRTQILSPRQLRVLQRAGGDVSALTSLPPSTPR
ncbi:hypothetical protein PINS_up013958 [Pythium insidiosum]|nr:hypothetical protein PINS_up013958 [Pythium insidiosum]